VPHRTIRVGIFAGLCWLYACIHFDRQILAILADSVKSDLHIGDAALGALTGSAFSLVYALLGLHFGRLSDQADRLAMVRLGACIWSCATLGGAMAAGYAHLVLARAGVALGEAMASVAAVSLMADLAGERYRARASSVFFASAFVGPGLAAIVGGAVLKFFQHSARIAGWRAALVFAALPGLLGALYLGIFRFKDAPRMESPVSRHANGVTAALVGAASLGVLMQASLPPALGVPMAVLLALGATAIWARELGRCDASAFRATLGQAAFRWLLAAFAAILFVDCAASFWLIPYVQRRFALSAALAGTQMGALMIAGGVIGSLAGGWISDGWHRSRSTGRIWTAFLAVLAETAALLLALAQADYRWFILAFSVFCLASGAWTGVTAAIGMDIIPRAHRGTGVAAYYLVTTILGPGLGAYIAGSLSGAVGSIGVALMACCVVIPVSIIGFVKMLQLSPASAPRRPAAVPGDTRP